VGSTSPFAQVHIEGNLLHQTATQGVGHAAIEIQGVGDYSQNPPLAWHSDYNLIVGSLNEYEFDTLIGAHDRNETTGNNNPRFQGLISGSNSAVSFMLKTDAQPSPCYPVTPGLKSDAIDGGFPGVAPDLRHGGFQ